MGEVLVTSEGQSVEGRLAAALEPTWFENVDGLPRPATLTDREWGQMVLNVHEHRREALRRAIDLIAVFSASGLALWPLRFQASERSL